MERKYITKGDLNKLLNENGLVPYNNAEHAHQYAENEHFSRNFLTHLNGNNVTWFTNKIPDETSLYFDGDVNVDWSIEFEITPNSFRFKPIVKSVIGKLRVYRNLSSTQKDEKFYDFNSKGYQIKGGFDDLQTSDNTPGFEWKWGVGGIEIDMNDKIIQISPAY